MAENKKGFVLYKSWITDIELLSDKDAGILFISILRYVNGLDCIISDNLNCLYNKIINQIEFEWSKYNPLTDKFHWNYKGGVTSENHRIRNSTEYKIWRKKVFDRDNYTCQYCGLIGGELNAHHKKHFSKNKDLRLSIDNGLTLCKPCHLQEHTA